MKKKEIYLDNAATTCVDKKIVKEMERFYSQEYGNPSSMHEMGEKAFEAMNNSRKKLASEINAKAHEIIFTSGNTESNNLAFFGLARSELDKKRKKIIVSAIEHSSIFEICDALKKEGFFIVEIPGDKEGIVNIDKLKNEIDRDTLLVSVMHVNNEIGVIQDISRIGEICRERGVYFHSDCAQSFGKLKIDVRKMNIDLLTASAHKIGGPKGIGLLYLRNGIKIEPLIYGGGQERGLRGGTENVPAIVGFALALDLAKKINNGKISETRDYFISSLEQLGGRINGSKEKRIFNNLNVSFSEIDGENLVVFLSHKGIYTSTGSACESKKQKESKVLREIGLNKSQINGSLRFSLDSKISKKDVDYVLDEIKKILKR